MNGWHWPQWVLLILLGLMAMGCATDNRGTGGTASSPFAVGMVIVLAWIIWMGGFWS